jgi:hypothetical protein
LVFHCLLLATLLEAFSTDTPYTRTLSHRWRKKMRVWWISWWLVCLSIRLPPAVGCWTLEALLLLSPLHCSFIMARTSLP